MWLGGEVIFSASYSYEVVVCRIGNRISMCSSALHAVADAQTHVQEGM